MKLFEAIKASCVEPGIKGFPPVVVDQTNCRIGEIIKRNLAGEQVMGNANLSFDYTNASQNYDPEKVNPFSDMGFDLDDVIHLAKENGKQVTDLQNRAGELKQALDQAQKIDQEKIKPQASAAPATPPAPDPPTK